MTHDLVLVEACSLLAKRLHKAAAIQTIGALRRSTKVEIVPMTPSLLEAAGVRCERFADKEGDWIDCASFELMERRALREALSLDHHFALAVGFQSGDFEDTSTNFTASPSRAAVNIFASTCHRGRRRDASFGELQAAVLVRLHNALRPCERNAFAWERVARLGAVVKTKNRHLSGIEANAAQTRLFISAEGEDLVNVIDPATDKVLKRIAVGPRPNEVAATPDGRLLYVPSGGTGFYEAVDVEQGKIVAKIKTGGSPHNVVCSADGQHMFLSPVGDPNRIFVVETATHRIVNTIPLGKEARPLTVRRDKKRLYIQHNELVGFELADVSDMNHCRILQTVHIELTPEQRAVPLRPVPCHGIALTPDEKELWVSDINHDSIVVFDATTEPPSQITQIPTKRDPHWLTFSPDGKYSYVSNTGDNEVQVVEVATRKTVKRIPMGKPERLMKPKPGSHAGGAGKGPKRILAVTVPQF